MENPVGAVMKVERPHPGVLGFIHKLISAPLTEDQCELLINVLFQLVWIRPLYLFEDLFQLPIHPFLGFCKDAVEVSKHLDLNHIGEAPWRKHLSASPARSIFHLLISLLFVKLL